MLKIAKAIGERVYRPFRPYIRRFNKAEIPTRADSLAFNTLLATVPVLGLAFWYLSSVGIAQNWQKQIESYIYSHLDVTGSSQVLIQFQKFTGTINAQSIGIVGLVVLLYTAYNLIVKFGDSIDNILNTHPEEPRFHSSFIKVLLRRGLLLLLLPVALVITFIITGWLTRDSWLRHIFDLPSVGPYLARPLPRLIDIFTLALIYHFIPRRKVSWWEALRAAFIVAPAFIGAKALIGIYNTHAISTQKIYGTLAALPLLIVWVQLAWLIILSGALFIRVRKAKGAKTPLPESVSEVDNVATGQSGAAL